MKNEWSQSNDSWVNKEWMKLMIRSIKVNDEWMVPIKILIRVTEEVMKLMEWSNGVNKSEWSRINDQLEWMKNGIADETNHWSDRRINGAQNDEWMKLAKLSPLNGEWMRMDERGSADRKMTGINECKNWNERHESWGTSIGERALNEILTQPIKKWIGISYVHG